jgi:multidrug efflux pump
VPRAGADGLSFIGIDGINTTPNSGRIQINLKSRDERSSTASEIIRRLQPEVAKVEGITLYMQPIQDLTVESRVSRTQYQYSMEDADAQELGTIAPQLLEKLRALPQCATSPAINKATAYKQIS